MTGVFVGGSGLGAGWLLEGTGRSASVARASLLARDSLVSGLASELAESVASSAATPTGIAVSNCQRAKP